MRKKIVLPKICHTFYIREGKRIRKIKSMLQDLLQLWIWKRSIYKKMQKLSWNLIIHEFLFASSDAKLPFFSESDCVLSSLNWHTKE